jgi:hypothetical protein
MRKLAMFVAAIAILSVGALVPTRAEAGWARPDIIGIDTARVLAFSTHIGASVGMAIAGIARACKAFG